MDVLNLEADGTAADIVGPPVAPDAAEPAPADPTPPPPEPDEPDVEPEGVVQDASGRKMVPLEALQTTRKELKAAKQLSARVAELQTAAERGQQLGAYFEQMAPLLDKLKNRPDLVSAAMQGQGLQPMPPGQPADPGEAVLPRAEAEDLARTMELYTPDGQPDLARARKLALFMRRTGREEAQGVTAPLTQTMAAGQAGTLKAQYAQVKDKHGRIVNPAILDQLWSIVPAELVARDPNVAGVLYYAAKGYASHHGLDEPAPPARAPIFTEPAGGRPAPTGSVLTDFDRSMQRTMQVTDKAYTETASKYKPGAINVLE